MDCANFALLHFSTFAVMSDVKKELRETDDIGAKSRSLSQVLNKPILRLISSF